MKLVFIIGLIITLLGTTLLENKNASILEERDMLE